MSRQMTFDIQAKTFISCKPFPEARKSIFASKFIFLERVTKPRMKIMPCDVFLCFAGFFEQIYYAIAEKKFLDKTER